MTDNDILAAGRRVPWVVGLPAGIPDWQASVSVSDYGAVAGDGRDDAAAFQAAIDESTAETVVRIPAGMFDLDATIQMKSGVALSGAGASQTKLRIGHRDTAIEFDGGGRGRWQPVSDGFDKGSTRLTLVSASDYKPGDYGVIRQKNDPLVMYTEKKWNAGWAQNSVGQVFKVVSVEGNTLEIAEPLNLDFQLRFKPQIRPQSMIVNSGLEAVTIARPRSHDSHQIIIDQGANIWLKNIISERAAKAHVHVLRSYGCEIRGSFFDDAARRGAGRGYGVELAYQVTGCLVENNVFRRLGLAMMVHLGANGNVFGYNYVHNSYDRKWLRSGISLHGHYPFANLFEGNILERLSIADYWGPAGPFNTFFRNLVTSKAGIEIMDHADRQNLIGNVVPHGSIDISDSVNRVSLFLYGNALGTALDSRAQGYSGKSIPASYYLPQKPAFYGTMNWPSIGSDRAMQTNPAQKRFARDQRTE